MIQKTVSDHWPVHKLLEHLHNIDNRILADFEKRYKRKVEHADRIKKIVEEIGEVIEANEIVRSLHHKNLGPISFRRKHLAEEVWDSALASLAQGYLLGLTNEEMMNGLNFVLEKLQMRWTPTRVTFHQ
jgi:NTP pyrophosphatase (non-canonical NTP hydrolase)